MDILPLFTLSSFTCYLCRPITSPVRPSGIPVPISASKKVTSPQGCKQIVKGSTIASQSPAKKPGPRTSRVDRVETTHEAQRPSSLPYKPVSQSGKSPKVVPQRRAASSSLNRRPISGVPRNVPPK